jgi:hypothetical protein
MSSQVLSQNSDAHPDVGRCLTKPTSTYYIGTES